MRVSSLVWAAVVTAAVCVQTVAVVRLIDHNAALAQRVVNLEATVASIIAERDAERSR